MNLIINLTTDLLMMGLMINLSIVTKYHGFNSVWPYFSHTLLNP